MSESTADLWEPKATRWIELFVDVDPQGHVSATVPVRWHIHADLVDKIGKRGFTNPYLLLVVRHLQPYDYGSHVRGIDRTNTSAYIIPLTQELQYVNFMRPGQNEIAATIVDITKDNSQVVREWKHNPTEIDLDKEGKPDWRLSHYNVRAIHTGAVVAVEVPREMFAPEPKLWQKKLVNSFFPTRENDQCHFRKRLIGAFLMAIPIQILGLVLRPIIALWVLYFGFRKVKWSRFWDVNPFGLVKDRSKGAYDGTWWTRDKEGRRRSGWWMFMSPLVPIVAFAAPAVTFSIFSIHNHDSKPIVDWGWWQTVVIVDVLIILAIASILLICLLLVATDTALDRRKARRAKADATTPTASATDQKRLFEELHAMAINRDTRVSLSALPKRKRTIVLRFYDFKAQVCRPFAR